MAAEEQDLLLLVLILASSFFNMGKKCVFQMGLTQLNLKLLYNLVSRL